MASPTGIHAPSSSASYDDAMPPRSIFDPPNRDDDDDHIFGEPPEYSPHFVPTAKEMIVMVPHSSFHH